MRKKIFLLCCFFIVVSGQGYAQNRETGIQFQTQAPSPNKEKIWIDSLKRIIKKGFTQNENKNNGKRYSEFVNSCVSLGLYYEKLYDTHVLRNMHSALNYYNKVISTGYLPYDEKYFDGSAVKTTLYRKLADIYFKGKGVKKDIAYSRELALIGIGYNSELFSFYSNRYYHCSCGILNASWKYHYDTDSVFSFWCNPFAIRINPLAILNDSKKKLEQIAAAYRSRNRTEGFKITIISYPENSAAAQARCYRLIDYFKMYLVHIENIPAEDITTICGQEELPAYDLIEVRFVK